MPATYEPIATTTLGSATSTITFSSIPATYTDLKIILNVTSSSVGSDLELQFNSDTGSNYSRTYLIGNGSSALSARTTNATKMTLTGQNATSTTLPLMAQIDVFSYAGSTNKTVLSSLSGDYNGSGMQENVVGLYRSTSAITSVSLFLNFSRTFSIGTTATLYGIKNA
jgi:hypothetical protein